MKLFLWPRTSGAPVMKTAFNVSPFPSSSSANPSYLSSVPTAMVRFAVDDHSRVSSHFLSDPFADGPDTPAFAFVQKQIVAPEGTILDALMRIFSCLLHRGVD